MQTQAEDRTPSVLVVLPQATASATTEELIRGWT